MDAADRLPMGDVDEIGRVRITSLRLAPASASDLAMISRMARVCAAGSPMATGLPPEPAVVPPPATMLPTRTAGEKPMIGS